MFKGRAALQFCVRHGHRKLTHNRIKNRLKTPSNLQSCRRLDSNMSSKSENFGLIQDEFTRQAPLFEEKWNVRMKRGNEEIMAWVMGVIGAIPQGARALDVASGTGIFARELAPLCKSVTALDATNAMLLQAEKKAAEEGKQNITFQQGDAANMPFDKATFDLVVCRLCIHHFARPETIVREMTRVCKPGGRVVIVDLTSVEDEGMATEHNRIEILRDPSHTRALSVPELCNLLKESGGLNMEVLNKELIPLLDVGMDLYAWMDSTNTLSCSQQEIISAFETDLGGGSSTGMHAYRDGNGSICFKHRWAIVIGVKG